jgi:hypothetical protein
MRNFNSLIVSASLNLTGLSGVLFMMHNSYRNYMDWGWAGNLPCRFIPILLMKMATFW